MYKCTIFIYQTKPAKTTREKAELIKNRKPKPQEPPTEEQKVALPKKELEPIIHGEFKLEDLKQAQIRQAQKRQAEQKLQEELSKYKELNGNKNKQKPESSKQKQEQSKQKSQESKQKQQDDTKHDKRSLNSEYDSDYGSDQSVDKYEVDYLQPQKNIANSGKSPKVSPKQQRKRWSWWK
jgi:hypothetical protein